MKTASFLPKMVVLVICLAPMSYAADPHAYDSPSPKSGDAESATPLSQDLREEIKKVLPRVNQLMPELSGTMCPVGFYALKSTQAGKKEEAVLEWREIPVLMPDAEAEPDLDNRVLRDILSSIQQSKPNPDSFLIFFERDNRIHLCLRDGNGGAVQYFVAPHPKGTKSDLKIEDFKPEDGKGLLPGMK